MDGALRLLAAQRPAGRLSVLPGGHHALLLLGWWAWGRYYKGECSEVGTVAKNSAVQVVMSLFNRAIDFAFAMLRLRVLSPEGEGSYVFAITFYMIAEIVTRFGLGTLLTRDVAFEKVRARKYLCERDRPADGALAGEPARHGAGAVHLPAFADAADQRRKSRPSRLFMPSRSSSPTLRTRCRRSSWRSRRWSIRRRPPRRSRSAKVALGGLVMLPPLDLGLCRAGRRQRRNECGPGRSGCGSAGAEGAAAVRCGAWPRRTALLKMRRVRPGAARNASTGAAAVHAARVRAADDQPPAGDGVLADQPVGPALRDQPGRGRHLLGGRQVHRRAERHPGLLHRGDLPADEPVCAGGQRLARQGVPARAATAVHGLAADRGVLHLCSDAP